MAITGGIKLFETSQCLEVNGSTITASSGNPSASYLIDLNPETKWRSVSSNDTITETIEITFDEDKTIDRIFVLDHNWKEFNIKYDVAGVWTAFSGVRGLSGTLSGITETAFADDTAYYEFNQVTTGAIQLNITKTQVANEEKYAAQAIVTSEIGTLVGYPKINNLHVDRNSRVRKTISGRYSVQKSEETKGFVLSFESYPSSSTYNVDMDLMMDLHDRESAFLVWLCGGRRGTNYFRYTLRGFRLKDVLQMDITQALNLEYTDNIYVGGLNASVTLEESI